jgi:hypothetical protein
MSRVSVEYNYGNLESSYNKKFPIFIDREYEDDDSIELSLEEAEMVIAELTKMVKDIKVKKLDESIK